MEVRLNSTLRGMCGQRSLQVDLPAGATVRDALAETVVRLPVLSGKILNEEELLPTVIIFLNGRNIRFFEGLDTVLQPGQILYIFPRSGAQRAFAAE